jgi:sulfofructose kinase
VSIFAAIGRDDVGALILKGFQEEGIDTRLVIHLEDHQSSFSSIVIDKSGERQIINYRNTLGTENLDVLQKLPIQDGYLADSRWNDAAVATLKLANKFSKPGVLDAEAPVSFEAVSEASHVAFSRQGLRNFTQHDDLLSGLRSLANKIDNWVCVTDGSAGVYYLDQGEPRNIQGPQVLAVDTLGAGDVWHGAFVLGLSEGKSEIDAIHFANLAAALKCTTFGGRIGIPTRSAVSDFNLSVIESE